ncbi:MAG: D-Ala-D-Ala carboxypeptidase family metallohydrolase [Aquabacterium sp.]|jgi:hypothetical protein|uniref:D-Ala-D-Ala carboxypeptidase family metallohydrolase n=1 Tax=Aquabacterium sp. TaxID=1872578 RepID=UPI003BAFAD50
MNRLSRFFLFRLFLLLMALPGLALAQAIDERSTVLFEQWRSGQPAQVQAFEAFLAQEQLAGIIPLRQLLRTASDWQRCGAVPFEVPPRSNWPDVRLTLKLVAELQRRQLLPAFEVHSAYRNPALNNCAHGAAQSAHKTHFALDITTAEDQSRWIAGLCRFWQDEGQAWNMGMSRYASGRIHIDTKRYRTWGNIGKTPLCAQ